jgi:hypothetical protein
MPEETSFREASVLRFFNCKQQEGEGVEEFGQRVRGLVHDCYSKFAKANQDQLVRDCFIHGLNESLKTAVLNQTCGKLGEAVAAAIMAESVKTTLEESKRTKQSKSQQNKSPEKYSGHSNSKKDTNRKKHSSCFTCGGEGHYARECPTKKGSNKADKGKPTKMTKKNEGGMVASAVMSGAARPMINGVVNGCRVRFLVDTGSNVSLLPKKLFVADQPKSFMFRTASASPLVVDGTLVADLKIGDLETQQTFYVGDVTEALLGMDFLKNNRLQLDTSVGTLAVQGHQVVELEMEESEGAQFITSVDASSCMTAEPVSPLKEDSKRIGLVQAYDLFEEDDAKKEVEIQPCLESHGLEEKDKLIRKKWAKLFEGLGHTDLVMHRIITDEKIVPIRCASYRLPLNLVDEARLQIEKMKRDGIVQPSNSEWSSPVVLVRKKNGDVRVAIDYRKLNEISKKDAYPMPRVDEILDKLGKARIFSKLDCNQGYYQISVAEEDREKTAFRFEGELLEFTRLPFGLSSAPATFNRLGSKLFASEKNIESILDDVIVFSESVEEHDKDLERALAIVAKAGLTLNGDKCEFYRDTVDFVGHTIKQGKLFPMKEKVQAIKDFPRPQNTKELKRFLGLTAYYKTMVKDFSLLAAPLYDMLKKSSRFSWEQVQEKAFQRLKEEFAGGVSRSMPDFARQFIIRTDASGVGIGALLIQETENGDRRVIECASKKFSECERRYPPIEQEAYAIMFALNRWYHYIIAGHFQLETDHRPLKWIQTKKDCAGKLGRWALRLAEFSFDVVHIPGRMNVDADSLSRAVVASVGSSLELLQKEQKEDKQLQEMKQQDSGKFVEVMGTLFWKEGEKRRVCIPRSLRDKVWKEVHDDLGHGGQNKVMELLRERFYWPGLRNDVKRRLKACSLCATRKDTLPQPVAVPMMSHEEHLLHPWEKVAIDVIGPFPEARDGSKYIMVLVDMFSKWAEAKPVPSIGAEPLKEWLSEVFSRWALPREILSDRGSDMESASFREFCASLGIRQVFTSAYHHQANPSERFNRTLLNMLRLYVDEGHQDWSEHVHAILLAYRVGKHESSKVSPFEAVHGFPPRLPVDLKYGSDVGSPRGWDELVERMGQVRQRMREQLKKASEYRMKQYNDRLKVQASSLKVGDRVYIRNSQGKKLEPLWLGPYVLKERLTDVNWLVQGSSDVSKVVHSNLLKCCVDDSSELGVIRKRGRPRKAPG